jgi:putative Mg2+ transporter-C (MgtC) family protein
MPTEIHGPAIALRLLLTVIAGAALGMDRSRKGHPAGLRTTLLVTMAASIAMIQMNLLLPTNGKPHDSYAVMDLMRLPLGILTGVGFIGAGAIIKKDDMVLGVTTASTLWFSTVVGLCLGGGQPILGSVSAVLGFLALTALRFLERRIEGYQPATLVMVTAEFAVAPAQLKTRLETARFRIKSLSVDHSPANQRQSIRCEVRWPARKGAADLPSILNELEHTPGLLRLSWRASGAGAN